MAMMGLTKKQVVTLAIIVFGTFVAVLNSTVVSPALPHVMAEMHVNAATAQWLTTGFTLVNAIMIPITAFLQDKFSTRRLFGVAMGVFTLGSVLCAAAPGFVILLVGRLVQAAGEGILMPLAGTVLMLTFPVERRGTAMGIFGVVLGFAPAFGPTVAGLVIDAYSWRIMFGAIAVLGLVTTVVGSALMQETAGLNPSSTLDVPSVVLSTLGFGGVLYALSDLGSNGVSPANLAVFAVGVVALVLFFRRQLGMETPMLQVRVLANRRFMLATVITMLVQGALMAGAVLVPIYLQTYRGFSATTSGLVMMPGAIIMGLMGLVAGRLFDKRGPRLLAIVGTGLLALSTAAFTILSDSTTLGFLTALYTVRLFSLSLVNMPIGTWGINALDNSLVNHGNSVNNTFRQVAGSLGTAIIVSVCTTVTEASAGTMDATHAGIHGINMAFLVATALCVCAFVLSVIFVRNGDEDASVSDPTGERKGILAHVIKTDVYTLPQSATVRDAVSLFVEKHISAAPIVDDAGNAVGFVSDGDVLRFLSPRTGTITDPITAISSTISSDDTRLPLPDKIEHLMSANVMSIATKGALGVDAHADLSHVCRFLGENHLKKAPVLEGGKVVGVINRSDIMSYTMQVVLEREAQRGQRDVAEQRG
ncbi:MAG: MDR family MFS transporter [Coriobacteriales bacterium]|jgi:DHA2 family multidrug resistance protein-like MFS transporter